MIDLIVILVVGSILLSCIDVFTNKVVDVVEVALLSHSIVVVAIWQLLPDASLSFAKLEQLLHVCWTEQRSV